MLSELLTHEIIWDLYITSYSIPIVKTIIVIILITLLAKYLLNHILTCLYNFFITTGDSKRLTRKKVKPVSCSCKMKPKYYVKKDDL
ncbi:MAG: hypothetical protein K0S41_3275 [Anaerocolumna sp.]|jgi:hypothetical protein|nr:hypothetical protein [Anaerocolumna sp.]